MSADEQTPADRSGQEPWWRAWGAARPATSLLHADTASAGRSSTAVLEAVSAHALREATTGGYVAAEERAGDLARARADAGTLLGTDADGVAFVESASRALEVLLEAWPLPAGARVAVAPSAWGPNVEVLRFRGLEPVLLPVEDDGVVDQEGCADLLRRTPPDLVLVDQVAAHRGLVQPVAGLVGAAREHGVPVWVDAAQSLGHVDAATGADAAFATSRKWLAGPRGVGLLTVAPQHRETLRVRPTARPSDPRPVHRLDSGEAHVAGRIGLGVALRELLEVGPERVHARLDEVGHAVREAAADLTGWRVDRPGAPAGSTTTLLPTRGQDVGAERDRLLHDHGVLTTVQLPWRAPLDMVDSGPGLRLSPHVDLDDEALLRLVRAVAGG